MNNGEWTVVGVSYRWLKREGKTWVAKGLIQEDQYQRILALYETEDGGGGMLPILGGLLLGVGMLILAAAHWGQTPRLIRLAVLVLATFGFLYGGASLRKRRSPAIGTALIGAGTLSFGAGLWLTARMYALHPQPLILFTLWGAAGALLTRYSRSVFLLLLTSLILLAGQLYLAAHSTIWGCGAGMWAAALVLLLLTRFPLLTGSSAASQTIWPAALYLQSAILMLHLHAGVVYTQVLALWGYTLAGLIHNEDSRIQIRRVMLSAGFASAAALAIFPSRLMLRNPDFLGQHLWLLAVGSLPILAAEIARTLRLKRPASVGAWLLFLPMALLPGSWYIGYLALLIAFSLSVLLRGYAFNAPSRIQTGTILFLFSVMAAYGKLAWGLMGKSFFFLIGGAILLGLSWWLNRRRKAG